MDMDEMIRKRKLSKGLLEMKFMKRSKDKDDKEREIEESTEMFSDLITKEMKSGANKTIIERSLARCKGLTDGRLSYQGMNPEIEQLMKSRMAANLNTKRKEPCAADVSDAEMAAFSLQMNKTIANKFMTKRERRQKRPKFLKPKDDDL